MNKMDKMGADFFGSCNQLITKLGKNPVLVQIPIGKEDEFKGIIDLFEMKAYIFNGDKGDDIEVGEIPADLKDQAQKNIMTSLSSSVLNLMKTLWRSSLMMKSLQFQN